MNLQLCRGLLVSLKLELLESGLFKTSALAQPSSPLSFDSDLGEAQSLGTDEGAAGYEEREPDALSGVTRDSKHTGNFSFVGSDFLLLTELTGR